jgi:glutamine amidotransferase
MVAVVDYRAGNLKSVANALGRLGARYVVTSDPVVVRGADRVVFPGVGAAPVAMHSLDALGLSGVIREVARSGRPFLGICLGAQIILDRSDEGDVACLGLLRGRAKRLPGGEGRKVPQMGWNCVCARASGHPVLAGIPPGNHFYFVHSYYPAVAEEGEVIAQTEYGVLFPSIVGRGNVVAVQFHPERSGPVGLRLLSNFLSWDGRA